MFSKDSLGLFTHLIRTFFFDGWHQYGLYFVESFLSAGAPDGLPDTSPGNCNSLLDHFVDEKFSLHSLNEVASDRPNAQGEEYDQERYG